MRVPRPISGQPNVYWTLVHAWVRIIGLYTNVHEDGEIAADQLDWLTGELAATPPGVTLILAMHRPVYSVDVVHGSNLDLGDALDSCFARAGRAPDAVFGAHSHNYQRFQRRVGGRDIPYVVAGNGGFYERHGIGTGLPVAPVEFPGLPGVTLRAHDCTRHGFMTVVARPGGRRRDLQRRLGRRHTRVRLVPDRRGPEHLSHPSVARLVPRGMDARPWWDNPCRRVVCCVRHSLPSRGQGEIAQLVEHTTENRGVPGSSPGLAIT